MMRQLVNAGTKRTCQPGSPLPVNGAGLQTVPINFPNIALPFFKKATTIPRSQQ